MGVAGRAGRCGSSKPEQPSCRHLRPAFPATASTRKWEWMGMGRAGRPKPCCGWCQQQRQRTCGDMQPWRSTQSPMLGRLPFPARLHARPSSTEHTPVALTSSFITSEASAAILAADSARCLRRVPGGGAAAECGSWPPSPPAAGRSRARASGACCRGPQEGCVHSDAPRTALSTARALLASTAAADQTPCCHRSRGGAHVGGRLHQVASQQRAQR